LAGPRMKVKWAKEYISHFHTKADMFLRKHHYPVIDRNSEAGVTLIRLRIDRNMPLLLWGVRIGTIVHQLRSSLDHLVYQLARINGCSTPKKTEFPIYHAAQKFEADGRRKIQLLAPAAQTIIEALQPYHRGNLFESDPLYQLHQLDLIDKHRTIIFAEGVIEEGGRVVLVPSTASVRLSGATRKPLQDGAILSRIPTNSADVNVEQTITLAVMFQEPGPLQGKPVIPTLTQFCDFTEYVIALFDGCC